MPDTPASALTTVSLGRPDTFIDRIDGAGDVDWFRLDLLTGQAITIEVERTSIVDPYLEVRDAAGTVLLSDDDSGDFTNALLAFRAADTGTFFISVSASPVSNSEVTGTYRITSTVGGNGPSLISGGTAELPVDPPPVVPVGSPVRPAPAAPAGPLASIMGDTILSDRVVTVYFSRAGDNFDGITSEGFTAYERSRFAAAFAQIEAVADLEFRVVSNPDKADFRLVLDTNEMAPRLLGYFYSPGTYSLAGVGVFNGAAFDRFGAGNLEPGGQGSATIVHELLHGLGLMHPHDTGGGSRIMSGVSGDFDSFGQGDLNQGIYTTMSYNPGLQTGWGNAPILDIYGYQDGPMPLDIAALQLMYGAAGQRGGHNTYTLPEQDGTGTGWQAIWDTGGTDRIAYAGPRDATIDLRPATLTSTVGGGGFISAVDGVSGGYVIAAGVTIERAYGGKGDDAIHGNRADNLLSGGGGVDHIMGDNGDDRMVGGAGADLLIGGQGRDRIIGQGGDDRLFGDAGADLLLGGGGADRFIFRGVRDSGTISAARDMILDFQRGVDLIDLSPLDGHATLAGNQALEFRGRAAFDGDRQGDVRIQSHAEGLAVIIDLDGDRTADMHVILRGVSTLSADDFIL